MSMSGRVVGLGAVVLSVACGGNAGAPRSPQVLAVSAPEATEPSVLTPVVAPPDVFAIARVSGLARIADTVVGWSSLPLDWRAELRREAPGFDQMAVLDAPLDFVAMLDASAGIEPKVLWAFAFGAVSTEAAARFFKGQGAVVVAGGGDTHRIRVDADLVCLATPALGAAAARVVCSGDDAGVDALSPYLSRGLPTESFGSADLHARVLAEPFRRRYGAQLGLIRTVGVPTVFREIALGHPRFDGALHDVLYGVADELVALSREIDRVEVEATMAPQADAIDVRTALVLAGQSSWTGGTLARAAGRAGVAPDLFWRLPGDAQAAAFSAPSQGDRMQPIAAALGQLADGWLDYQGLPEPRRGALIAALTQVLTWEGRSAHASIAPLGGGVAPGQGPDEELRATLRSALGGHLFGVDRSGDRLVRLAAEVVAALGDPAFRARLVKAGLGRDGELPVARSHPPKGAGFPRGTQVFEVVLPSKVRPGRPKGAPPPAPLAVFLVAAPDGATTWFAFGMDEKALLGRVREVLAGKGPALSARDALAPLRTEPVLSGGFASLAGVLAGLPAGSLTRLPSLDHLPHRGETPILWKAMVEGRGPTLSGTARFPRALVEDLAALLAASSPRLTL